MDKPKNLNKPAQMATAKKELPTTVKASPDFTRNLAREIVKNLVNFGQLTTRPFQKTKKVEKKPLELGENPIFVDTSILVDGRILPVVNSGFIAGTLVIPQFILGEVQHIADSEDPLRRAKGRRGLEVINKLKAQKNNPLVKTKIINEELLDIREADQKLVALAKRAKCRLMTVDFNLAQSARVQGVKILNLNDLAQALKLALVPGEELTIKITHVGRDRSQGVGYLSDGTMVVVDNASDRLNTEVTVIVTKVHQTPAGQLFFARLK